MTIQNKSGTVVITLDNNPELKAFTAASAKEQTTFKQRIVSTSVTKLPLKPFVHGVMKSLNARLSRLLASYVPFDRLETDNGTMFTLSSGLLKYVMKDKATPEDTVCITVEGELVPKRSNPPMNVGDECMTLVLNELSKLAQGYDTRAWPMRSAIFAVFDLAETCTYLSAKMLPAKRVIKLTLLQKIASENNDLQVVVTFHMDAIASDVVAASNLLAKEIREADTPTD